MATEPYNHEISAGVDAGADYFGDSGLFNFNNFDNAVVDYTTNDGTDVLFDAGEYDGSLVGGGFNNFDDAVLDYTTNAGTDVLFDA